MFKRLREDIAAIKERDPAMRSTLQILLFYPGLKAVIRHRWAHWFYNHKMYFIAEFISKRTRKLTGIEIHPAAKIGRRLVIDHGMGVVIGETTEIGDNCTIYQGVTLGGTGKETGKRHPTIGNNVLIGSGAKILGPFKVGDNSRIAANAVVLDEVPPNSTAVGVPARVVKRDGVRIGLIDHVHIPDPISQELCRLNRRIETLERELEELKKQKEGQNQG